MAALTKDKILDDLIQKAHSSLAIAQDYRIMVTDYLMENYEVSLEELEDYRWVEDECNWCYGLDIDLIKELIENHTKT